MNATVARKNSVLDLVFPAIWLASAFLVGGTRLLSRFPMPVTQALLISVTACLLTLYWYYDHIRETIDSIPLRALVLLHVTRFVGFYFLVLRGRGELPYEFAVPAAIGDIAVAAGALAVVLPSPHTFFGLGIWLGWNVCGLLDILFVVGTAARLGLSDPASMQALTRLPLSLLPTFLVPLIIASHVILFVRLRRLARNQF